MKLFEGKEFYVLGHRGCSEFFPENTIESFDACASDDHVDGIELDVHLCKSGEVVVAHDFSLSRTAGLDRELEDMTWEEIQKVDVGSFKGAQFAGCRIPLLSQVLSRYGKRFFYDIELKVKPGRVGRELSRKTLEIVESVNLTDRVMVSSFNPFALRYFTEICMGKIETGDIFDSNAKSFRVLSHGAGNLISKGSFQKPDFSQVDEEFLKKHSLPAIVWTADSEEEAMRLRKLGVKGLIGNNPHIL